MYADDDIGLLSELGVLRPIKVKISRGRGEAFYPKFP
jgi:hypothetical protein